MFNISYIEKEIDLIQFWKDHKIFEKSVEQRSKKNPYVFYDGPPFATGLPHYGHILSFVTKDVFPRFWTMKKYRVDRRWGWDCHGLPIESICERELDIRKKKEIFEMGIDKFNEFCRSKVLWYTSEWKKIVERMGKWIEFDNAYKTMDNTYMETIWYIFKKIFDKGLVYQGKKILLYCPRCETPLSNFEITMDDSYKDVTETSIIAKFKLKHESNTYLLAWTTTPWTLIGNVALAINPNLYYVKIKIGQGYFIIVNEQLRGIKDKYEMIEEFKGVDLINKEYEPLYNIPSEKRGYIIIDGGEDVIAEEGTGIVHMAIYGEFDYEVIKKYDLPIIQHIDSHGNLALGPKKWIGEWFKHLDPEIIKDLNERNLLFMDYDYTHSYPFCYRCDTPLLYNALDAWFINIQKIKPRLLETSNMIKFFPQNINIRFEYIITTAPDWCVSRNRFWATAIPIWICDKCEDTVVIGSVSELKERAIESVPEDPDLHKHTMDYFHLKCIKCGGRMSRIPEVIDCWFESGCMPFAAKYYPFENKDWFKTNFPADFVSEYIGQVRAWFYYMHVISVLVFDNIPFKNVVVNGNILATDGSKMSKSKRNFPDPNLIIEKYGADALRLYLLSSQLMRAQDLNFNEEGVKTIYRRFNLLLVNVLKFYLLFETDNYSTDVSNLDNILDKWIVSLTNNLIKNITNNMENYDTAEVSKLFFDFIENLSTWYIRNSRSRFKSEDLNKKLPAIRTLSYVLLNLSKLLAPMTPFISEMIYQKMKERKLCSFESVHLDFWPSYDPNLINLEIHNKMDEARTVIKNTLEIRDKSKIHIRQPLKNLIIKGVKIDKEYLDIIAMETNVKNVEVQKGDALSTELDTKITPDLKLEGISRDLIRNLNNYRKKMNLTFKNRIKLYIEISDSEIRRSFEKFEDVIRKKIQANEVFYYLKKNQEPREIKINNTIVKTYIEILEN